MCLSFAVIVLAATLCPKFVAREGSAVVLTHQIEAGVAQGKLLRFVATRLLKELDANRFRVEKDCDYVTFASRVRDTVTEG